MNIINAIILGIIQGLTEFLPISSTAHLTIVGKLLGLVDPANPERWTAFIAVIQLGTMAAVIIYFYKEIINIIKSFHSENFGDGRKPFSQQSNDSRLGWLIVTGSIPLFTIGLLLHKIIESNITKDPIVIACSLIGLAIFLFIAEKVAKVKKEMKDMSILDSIIIGLAQCVALIPGASRSGTTITAGLFTGLKREQAARYSFLLSIPAVLSSGLYEFYKSMKYVSPDDKLALVVATVISAATGLWAISFLLKFLKNNNTYVFVVYRILAGILIIAFVFGGILK